MLPFSFSTWTPHGALLRTCADQSVPKTRKGRAKKWGDEKRGPAFRHMWSLASFIQVCCSHKYISLDIDICWTYFYIYILSLVPKFCLPESIPQVPFIWVKNTYAEQIYFFVLPLSLRILGLAYGLAQDLWQHGEAEGFWQVVSLKPPARLQQ